MKKILMLLALVAGVAHADIVGPTAVQQLDTPPIGTISGSLTYALNNSLTGVASSAIDLNGYTGLFLTVTMTGTGIIDVISSNSNVTYGAKVYSLTAPTARQIPISGRYVTLRNSGNNQATARMSAYYYLGAPASAGGGSTTAVSVTASPVFNPLSFTTYVWQTYTAAVHNLTAVAGASVRCTVCYGPSFGGAGIRVAWGTSASAPSDIYGVGLPIATSATGQCFGPFAPGTIFYSIGSGSASVTGRLQVDGVY